MDSRFVPIALAFALVATAGIAAPVSDSAGSASAEEKEMIRNAWGELQEKPRYGGTINYVYWVPAIENSMDNYWGWGGMWNSAGERLGQNNWAVPREIEDYKNWWGPNTMGPGLAESWEQPDPGTTVFHIREGVKWHNLPPVNGREFTAKDVEYVFHRVWGLGSGFSERSPHAGEPFFNKITSVEATDKYTVVFKHPVNAYSLPTFLTAGWSDMIAPPREVVEEHGDMKDPAHVIGTGPWMFADYVPGSSLTWVRNPDYWQNDALFPDHEFQLPYADEFRQLAMPEKSTQLAALRSGKLDRMDGNNWGDTGITWEQKESLDRTNPELQFAAYTMTGSGLAYRYGTEPLFPDIRVRQALDMAIDREQIARTWGGGYVEAIPQAWTYTAVPGFYRPWDEIPEEVRETYTYNPEKAKQLLAEAGYPDGFKTQLLLPSDQDTDLYLIVQSHLAEIGVDMEIEILDPSAHVAMVSSGEWDGITIRGWGIGYPGPIGPARHFYGPNPGANGNIQFIQDSEYDALIDAAASEADLDAYQGLLTAANDYIVSQHWRMFIIMNAEFRAWQPWIKSYRGENRLGTDYGHGLVMAHVWVDQELKSAMGN